jgi:hypothetical protein
MKTIAFYIAILSSCFAFSQQNLLSLHSFYKDQLFANKGNIVVNNGSFLPFSEGDFDLISAINDSSKQYYDVTEILFKKHLFEIEGKDYKINISPLFDFSRSFELNDTLNRKLFQNTRGILVEADLFKNFSFATMFFENQGRFAEYQDAHFRSVGEQYPKNDTLYVTANAVIPGAGRTKNFKGDGLDYAYAIGYMSYVPHQNIRITAGNNQQFIGDGHRSILLSDNSYSAPYFRIDWNILPKLRYSISRARTLNLIRRDVFTSTEPFYEIRNMSVNYLTYMPNDNVNISLFDGGQWYRGDSLNTNSLNAGFYNPVPLLNSFIIDENTLSSLVGINLGVQISKNHRVYGQVAINDMNFDLAALQLGYRGYNFFGLNDFMIQTEFNVVPNGFYENDNNPRLNYTHYNLPLAHSKGQGFSEFIVRANYEFNRFYADLSMFVYQVKDYSYRDLLSIYEDPDRYTGRVMNTITELGYRFNRKVNLCGFVGYQYRADHTLEYRNASIFTIGLRTGWINQYKDF